LLLRVNRASIHFVIKVFLVLGEKSWSWSLALKSLLTSLDVRSSD